MSRNDQHLVAQWETTWPLQGDELSVGCVTSGLLLEKGEPRDGRHVASIAGFILLYQSAFSYAF